MNLVDSLLFNDASFPITISPNRVSIVDNLEKSNKAVHEALEIKYFVEGSSTLLIDNQTLNVDTNDVVVINPYQTHATLNFGEEKRGKYHLIMIGLDFINIVGTADYNLRNLFFGKKLWFTNLIKQNQQLNDIILQIVKISNEDSTFKDLALYGLVCQLFSWLLSNAVSRKNSASSSDIADYYGIIEPALRMIRDSYSRSFSLDEFAEQCNVSKFHFCRIFKTVMGTSAINYLNEYRLNIANSLLLNTNKQVQEIASLCGFNDVGYFCKLFKKRFNKSPKKTQIEK